MQHFVSNHVMSCSNVYLENINLILAFIINIISQPIEHLNISSAFIVRLIRKCTWYTFQHNRCIYRYKAQLATSCLGGSVGRTREYCTLIFLSSALLVRILHATFIFVTTLKTFVLFLLNFLLLQNCFSIFINLISLVTITFTRRIRNTVLQLSPVASSVFKI